MSLVADAVEEITLPRPFELEDLLPVLKRVEAAGYGPNLKFAINMALIQLCCVSASPIGLCCWKDVLLWFADQIRRAEEVGHASA